MSAPLAAYSGERSNVSYSGRLNSWKEIALYLQSGVRTVQRWEKTEDLPVYRHLHEKLGSVYSFKSELDVWRRNRSNPICTSGTFHKTMVAVLPLRNLSGDPEQEYFSDGLTEEIIVHLGQVYPRKLGVIARTSVARYKGSSAPIYRIGQELGVGYVLEGSVRREKDRVRVTAQLVDARDQTELWADTYERSLTAIFAVQQEIAQRVANSLAIELLKGFRGSPRNSVVGDMAAYEAYLRGRYFTNKRTKEGLNKAVRYFEQALTLDPHCSLAYAGIADCCTLLGFYTDARPTEVMPKAKAAALKALEMNESLGEAHTSLGDVLSFYDWDWDGAEQEFLRAIELNPSYATAHHWYANYLSALGRHTDAHAEIQCALRLDPLSLIINAWAGVLLYLGRQYDQAIEQLTKTLELDSSFSVAHAYLGMAYEERLIFREAIAHFEAAVDISASSPVFLAMLAHGCAMSGNTTEAVRILDGLLALSAHCYVPSYVIAVIYVGLRDFDAAFRWMNRSCDERCIWLSLLNVDPRLDTIRSDRRFSELLQHIGLGAGPDYRYLQTTGGADRP